jgi:dCTP deaminase
MLFSSSSIENAIQSGDISIYPIDHSQLKPASYTFKLGSRLYKLRPGEIIYTGQKPEYQAIDLTPSGYLLQPGEYVLGETLEHLKLSDNLLCQLSTRGSIAQIGLNVLLSSTVAEPGTDNVLLLEISNASANPIMLYPNIPIVKGLLFRLD